MTEKTYTEREVRELQRNAFKTGVNYFYIQSEVSPMLGHILDKCEKRAEQMYPLPKITRPRVVQSPTGFYHRVVNGRLEESRLKHQCGEFLDCDHVYTKDIASVADLLANPNETVDA